MRITVTKGDKRGAGLVEPVYIYNNTFDGNDMGVTMGPNVAVINNIFS